MGDKHPGIPKRVDLTGCSFQGKQLSAQELKERERRSEAMEEHRKIVGDNVIILRRKHSKATGNEPETRKVSVRGRHFSSNEIRKEYGIMAKPYKLKTMNILWCIINQGPIDLRGMADALDYHKNYALATKQLSGPISNIYKHLGDKTKYSAGWLTRESDGNRFFYSVVGEERSVEVMYNKNLEVHRLIWNDKHDAKSPDPEATIENEKRREAEEEAKSNPTEMGFADLSEFTNKTIQESVSDAISKILGIKVEVNGTINILFGFKERK